MPGWLPSRPTASWRRAGVLDYAANAQIRTVSGYRGKQDRNVDQARQERVGGRGWQSPHMPLHYASRGAIANEGSGRADD